MSPSRATSPTNGRFQALGGFCLEAAFLLHYSESTFQFCFSTSSFVLCPDPKRRHLLKTQLTCFDYKILPMKPESFILVVSFLGAGTDSNVHSWSTTSSYCCLCFPYEMILKYKSFHCVTLAGPCLGLPENAWPGATAFPGSPAPSVI